MMIEIERDAEAHDDREIDQDWISLETSEHYLMNMISEFESCYLKQDSSREIKKIKKSKKNLKNLKKRQ